VRFFFTLAISVLLVGSASAAPALAAVQAELPASLIRLAAGAKSSRSWPELRRYAQSRRSAQDRALAYFVLGYREYQSEDYEAAEKDLGVASPIDFPFADLARYYHAGAAYRAGHPERVAKLLGSFSVRFPSSPVRYKALELLAWGYLQTGQAESALKALQSEPEVRQRPALALLLAQAYLDDGKLKSAARAYQEVYNAFPATPEAKAAGTAVEKLKASLGVSFPPVSDEIATARVEKLSGTSHFAEALKGYNELLKDRQGSTWAWRWNLGRAQCLLRQGRADEAIETLARIVPPTPEIDAQRLAILVEAYVRTGNETAAAQAVNQLRSSYLKSPWHAKALQTLANYFMRKGNRKLAGLYYRTLAELFPRTSEGLEASWRLAWISYLAGNSAQAQELFLAHIRNYPQSTHVPAALYYLGRLEQEKHPSTARALYALIARRFVHDYYALEANRQLKALPRESASAAGLESGFSVAELAAKIPSADPPAVQPCQRAAAGEALRTFDILKAVHLDTLAEQDLRAQLARQPSSVPLLLALSRFAAEQGKHDLALHSARKIVPDYYSQQFSELPREIWDLLFPTTFRTLVRRHASLNRLDPYLVMALIRQESAFNPQATSPSNALGLMQIVPGTVTRSRRYQRTVAQRLYNPTYNVRFGCAYLRKLLKQFDGNVPEALAAYNAGPSRVSQWLSDYSFRDPQEFVESIPFQETRIYVKGVLKDRMIYHQLVTASARFAECGTRPRAARKESTPRRPVRSRRRARLRSVNADAAARR
jgi:soluble lytic murein transglycosylase